MRSAIVATRICAELCDCLVSATVSSLGKDSVFQVWVLPTWMLKLDDQTLVHFISQPTWHFQDTYPPKWLSVRRGRSRAVEDGGRERLWSGCEPKPFSADQMHPTYAAKSPRAHETASSIVCRIWVYMAARISTWNRAMMKKWLFCWSWKPVWRNSYPIWTPRLVDTVLDVYTREPIKILTQRYLSILRFCKWSKLVRHQKSALFGSEIRRER